MTEKLKTHLLCGGKWHPVEHIRGNWFKMRCSKCGKTKITTSS